MKKRGRFEGRLKVKVGRIGEVYRDIIRIHEDSRDGLRPGKVHRFSTPMETAYFILRGSDQEDDRGSIVMDDVSRSALRLCPGQSEYFEVVEAGFFGELRWAWNASEPAYRVAAKLAVLSMVLGTIGSIEPFWHFITWLHQLVSQ